MKGCKKPCFDSVGDITLNRRGFDEICLCQPNAKWRDTPCIFRPWGECTYGGKSKLLPYYRLWRGEPGAAMEVELARPEINSKKAIKGLSGLAPDGEES